MDKFSLQHKLTQHAEKVKKAAEHITASISDWQTIRQYLSNRASDLQLNDIQEKKLERYQYVYNQLVTGKYTHHEIVNHLTNKKLFGISLRQALNDMECCKELWASVINVKRTFEITIELEINRRLMYKAEEMGDMKAAAQFEKNRILLLKLLPEEEDTSAELFEGHIIEAVFDPSLLGAPEIDMREILEMVNAKRKVKINIDMFVTDITHEDVTDANETTSL